MVAERHFYQYSVPNGTAQAPTSGKNQQKKLRAFEHLTLRGSASIHKPTHSYERENDNLNGEALTGGKYTP
jgi:hypothetical protein